jgi:phenylalanyl-tRNA synthetase beta subunit
VNYYSIAKNDLDRAIGMATSYYDFEDLMKAMDYELIYRGDKLSIKRSPYKKNIRIERYFGSEYSIDRIKQRIDEEYIKRVPFIEEYGNKKSYNAN